jgi:TetR/AcrR family transcriptional regulator, transcriptional repressor for nem operon
MTTIMIAFMTLIMYDVKLRNRASMKVSREQVEDNRRKVLDAAGRLFRERGFAAVTVSEVMQAAGLTHGAFYGHFSSKEELIAQAIEHALTSKAPDATLDIARYTASYLSQAHRDQVADGCPIVALATEAARSNPEVRAALTRGVQRHIEQFTDQTVGSKAEKRRAAIGTMSAMVGAVVLARLSDNPELSDELLAQTQAFLRDGRRQRSKPRSRPPARGRLRPRG